MQLDITTYGNPVLRETSQDVTAFNEDLRKLVEDMRETMHAARGLGLAAQQVGRTEALCVIDVPAEADVDEDGVRQNPDVTMPLILVNPEVTERSAEKAMADEGCLSFPGLYAPVQRSREVTVRYRDPEGELHEVTARGLVARAIQHECDHLKGILICDKLSQIKRVTLSGKLKKLRRETQKALKTATIR